MMTQISIFAENTKGAMRRITSLLLEHGINISSILTNDSGEFGVVRMIVSEPEKARDALERAGYLCHREKVIGVRISDAPGSLDRLLADLMEININVEYLYISFDRDRAAPIMVFRTLSAAEVAQSLQSRGYEVL